MEPIPEEGTEADGSEWGAMSDTAKRTMRKKEVYTSEQINTLVRLVFFFGIFIFGRGLKEISKFELILKLKKKVLQFLVLEK